MIVVWILLGLIALVLLLAAIMPSRYAIAAHTVIDRPPRQVFDSVADLNRYAEWNPWQKTDPSSKQVVSGQPGVVGHSYAWDGKKVGVGSLTLRKALPGEAIEFDLRFVKPWKAEADDMWKLEAKDSGTRVTWANSGNLPYPMGRLFGPLITSGLKKQFAEGLASLKALVEKG